MLKKIKEIESLAFKFREAGDEESCYVATILFAVCFFIALNQTKEVSEFCLRAMKAQKFPREDPLYS